MIKLFFISVAVFFSIDMVWLGLIAKQFYRRHLGFIMRPDVGWFPAIIFYLLFIAGLVTFVISPALEKHSWLNAVLFGAFFGLVTYSTYDLTNLATLKNWPVIVTVVDLIWGTILSASVSGVTYLISVKISNN
jgi:uncharacterized membrane protein